VPEHNDTICSPTPKLQLRLGDETEKGQHFIYSIAHSESVRAAWIEVLDRPLLLDRTSVVVQAEGELDRKWDTSGLNGWEQPEDQLVLSIWDPNGESIFCEGTTMYAQPGGEVSSKTVGGREAFRFFVRLDLSFMRVAQDSSNVTFDVTGSDLAPRTQFHVQS
jgi:hypothetical protein